MKLTFSRDSGAYLYHCQECSVIEWGCHRGILSSAEQLSYISHEMCSSYPRDQCSRFREARILIASSLTSFRFLLACAPRSLSGPHLPYSTIGQRYWSFV